MYDFLISGEFNRCGSFLIDKNGFYSKSVSND